VQPSFQIYLTLKLSAGKRALQKCLSNGHGNEKQILITAVYDRKIENNTKCVHDLGCQLVLVNYESVKSFLGFNIDIVNDEIRRDQPTVVNRMENRFHLMDCYGKSCHQTVYQERGSMGMSIAKRHSKRRPPNGFYTKSSH